MLLAVCGPQVGPQVDTLIYCKRLECPTFFKEPWFVPVQERVQSGSHVLADRLRAALPQECVSLVDEQEEALARRSGPVEDLVHGGDAVAGHRRNVATRHDGVVHARVHGKLFGKHGLAGAGRAVEE